MTEGQRPYVARSDGLEPEPRLSRFFLKIGPEKAHRPEYLDGRAFPLAAAALVLLPERNKEVAKLFRDSPFGTRSLRRAITNFQHVLDIEKHYLEDGALDSGTISRMADTFSSRFSFPGSKNLGQALKMLPDRVAGFNPISLSHAVEQNAIRSGKNWPTSTKDKAPLELFSDLQKQVSLLAWEEALGNPKKTTNVSLVMDFFERRGKPEVIGPTLERLAERSLTEGLEGPDRIMNQPEFARYVSAERIEQLHAPAFEDLDSSEDEDEHPAERFYQNPGLDQIIRAAERLTDGPDSDLVTMVDNFANLLSNRTAHRDPAALPDAHAALICAMLIGGKLDRAQGLLAHPTLQLYRDDGEIEEKVRLAWEHLTAPDPESPGNQNASVTYLAKIAFRFGQYLLTTESAQPYLRLFGDNSGELEPESASLLDQLEDMDLAAAVYERIGQKEKAKSRVLQIFHCTYDEISTFHSDHIGIGEVPAMLASPALHRYFTREEIADALVQATERSLVQKNRWLPDRFQPGTARYVLKLSLHPDCAGLLQGKLDVPKIAKRMIAETINQTGREILTRRQALLDKREFSTDLGGILETYMIADRVREQIDPVQMGGLVAFFLAAGCDGVLGKMSYCDLIETTERRWAEDDPSYPRPAFFKLAASRDADRGEAVFSVLTNVYEREKELGTLNTEAVANAVTNVVYRGLAVTPNRFAPEVDFIRAFLRSPLGELYPKSGREAEAIADHRILGEFLDRGAGTAT